MENFSKSYANNVCIAGKLHHFLSVSEIFGMNIFKPCKCRKTKISVSLFSTYQILIEIYLWFAVIILVIFLAVDIPCGRIFLVFEEHAFYGKFLPLTCSLYVALQFSITRRNKIKVHSMTKSNCEGEEKYIDKVQFYVRNFFSYIVILHMSLAILIPLIGHSYVDTGKKYRIRQITCLVSIQIWFMITSIHLFSMSSVATICVLLVSKRLSKISLELHTVNKATKYYLQNLIEKFMELWEFFQQVNEKWELYLPLIYIHFVYESCFLLYGTLFAKMNLFVRLFMATLALQLLSFTFLVSWGLSTLTSVIYDNFISVEKYFSDPLTLTYKLKVVCFMKIFGGMPIGISVGGFFFVKQNFLIRAASACHSVFSTLIELTGVLDENKCISKLHPTNTNNDTLI
ncbi:uncharacterized protein [Centruroides vittatus]|uniref:uncharacterized protein n=1 Tax=Centruroides vittatus TaxID=120091 RepID=UPI003510C3FC